MTARTSKSGGLRTIPGRILKGVLTIVVGALVSYIGFCVLLLTLYTLIFPPITGIQLQRQIEAIGDDSSYSRQYQPVPRDRLSANLRHAVIAAEDGRFYEHSGIDWEAVRTAAEEIQQGTRRRGGSTITQQLVKNLFMTTHPTYFRKAMEVPLSYAAEFILGKERILDLYVNVVELDDGVFGAEAASRHYFGQSAENLSRYQAAGLAACLPNPRSRTPQGMANYTNTILVRMGQMGW